MNRIMGYCLTAALSACVSLTPSFAANAPEGSQREMPRIAAGATASVTATVEAVDLATREVALRGPDGKLVRFVAGPEVRNLEQVEIGDKVDVVYAIGMVVALAQAGEGIHKREDTVETSRAQAGHKPAGIVRHTVYARGTVESVDTQARTVTIKGALRTVTLPVSDDVNLDKIKVGDEVDAAYTESLAITVRPAGN